MRERYGIRRGGIGWDEKGSEVGSGGEEGKHKTPLETK